MSCLILVISVFLILILDDDFFFYETFVIKKILFNVLLLFLIFRCRKFFKVLKEWQVYEELKKIIDDFNEICFFLEMMVNKVMMFRYWERIVQIIGYIFDVEVDNFLFRNLIEVFLLQYKEDIEDVCISVVKEKDIEVKLK